MLGAWNDQCITLQNINIINETLHTKFMNDTLVDIANSTKFPKLRKYKLFKKDFWRAIQGTFTTAVVYPIYYGTIYFGF